MSDTLYKTYFIDLDGTILKFQDQFKLDAAVERGGESYKDETLLPGAREFLDSIDENDCVVITTARTSDYIGHTVKALEFLGVRYDKIIFSITSGPRIVVNDTKEPGIVNNKLELNTAYGLNVKRDSGDFSKLHKINKQINGEIRGSFWGVFKKFINKLTN